MIMSLGCFLVFSLKQPSLISVDFTLEWGFSVDNLPSL
ncbi:hypothetical protein YSA_09162 [Pseudomonas putida ND6]|uniref:Uncharacterized protein n=1 Tax=Pseudomonas putida ND6 TaxID=231023 RepID=I3V1V7_PSEPU|nr:hypothetical protein YSA_09162 [Pseudomonas putida ND6]